MDSNFWQGKKVLVTGATGFVGSKIVERMLNSGAMVVGVGRRDLNPALSRLRGLSDFLTNKNFIFEKNNLAELYSLTEMFKKHEPDTVFHLAASAIVSEAAKNPSPTIASNVIGTLNILEAIRNFPKVRRVLLASSDKTYGDHSADRVEPLPFKESYALKGLDIYSSSKTCADLLAQAYAFQYKIPVAILRCCNIYGPGDINITRLIPRTILRLLTGKSSQIKLGHEKVLREYMHIEDVVEAYLLLAEKIEEYYGPKGGNMPIAGQQTYGWPVFNAGCYSREQVKQIAECENIKSVSEVIELLRLRLSGKEPEIIEKAPEYIEIPDEYSDSSKLLSLGFKPKLKFSQGLESTVVWYEQKQQQLADILNLDNL